MINIIPWTRRRGDITDPGSLLDVRSDMDRMFDRFFDMPGFGPMGIPAMTGMFTPALEIFDEGQDLVIRAEVPGIDPEDIDINVSGNRLTISGEKREESEENRGGMYRSEVRYGRFNRVIELPQDVDADKVTAECENGVLTLRIPKSQDKRPKKIPVGAGASRKQMQGSQQGQQPGRQESNRSLGQGSSDRGVAQSGMASEASRQERSDQQGSSSNRRSK